MKELRSKRDLLQEQLTDLIDVSRCETKISKQKFNQSVKRLSQKLIMQNRLKGRKLGAGARRLLDSDDEEFIARAVESKSTSHGRRHDVILYIGHGVKYRDLLSLANYSLYKKGKCLIRSASTVYNRGRPKRINSAQAKKHIGNWLFCAKKPPKTEKEGHESTHCYDMRALCLHNVTHIRDPSIIVYMPTRGCLSFFFFFFLFLHNALNQLGLGHQYETWCQ